VFLRGKCVDGAEGFKRIACKMRGCLVCGVVVRRKHAIRIAAGIRAALLRGERCAVVVLTQRSECGVAVLVDEVERFIRWVRKQLPGVAVEYVKSFELQRRGVLHVNLVFTGWDFILHSKLAEAWRHGSVSVSAVVDGRGVGDELVKAGRKAVSATWVGRYMVKLDDTSKAYQLYIPVGADKFRKSVTFSRGWPEPPELPVEPGPAIAWSRPDVIEREVLEEAYGAASEGRSAGGVGVWRARELAPDFYVLEHRSGARDGPSPLDCNCFSRHLGPPLRVTSDEAGPSRPREVRR